MIVKIIEVTWSEVEPYEPVETLLAELNLSPLPAVNDVITFNSANGDKDFRAVVLAVEHTVYEGGVGQDVTIFVETDVLYNNETNQA